MKATLHNVRVVLV